MKIKYILTIPLLSFFALSSCDNSKKEEYKVSCETNGVTLSDTKAYKGQDFSCIIGVNSEMSEQGYILPTSLTKVNSGNREIQNSEYVYTLEEAGKKASFKIPGSHIEGDVVISLTLVKPGPTIKRWYEYEDWWNHCSNGKLGEEATIEDVGKEVEVGLTYVDGSNTTKIHKVRLIDVDHKGLPHISGKEDVIEAHCTFEFENVVTLANGEYYPTIWNGNAQQRTGSNYNYKSSVLNYNLNNFVFDAMPPELQNKIKTINKEVAIYYNQAPSYVYEAFQTKLFALSYREITKDEESFTLGEGSTYTYYKVNDTDSSRIKTLAGGSDNEIYWLRSPLIGSDGFRSWHINENGEKKYLYGVVYSYYSAAPAFCI